MASRRTQPYRNRRRRPIGPALNAMKRGKPRYMPNPQDAKRAAAKKRRKRRRNPYRRVFR